MSTTDNEISSVDLAKRELHRLLDSLDQSTGKPQKDARRFRRTKYRVPKIMIHLLNHRMEEESRCHVPTRNISSKGLAFLHKQMLPTGQGLHIDIPLLDEQTLRVLAEVVHCRHVKGMVHEIGVQFLRISLRGY